MLRRPSLSSFLASVVRRAHQWIAASKLMGLILSVVHYLFANPRFLVMAKAETSSKTVGKKTLKDKTLEDKNSSDTNTTKSPRILSVCFFFLALFLSLYRKKTRLYSTRIINQAPSWDSINNNSFFSDGRTSPGDSPPWGWFVSLSPHSELFPSARSTPDVNHISNRGAETASDVPSSSNTTQEVTTTPKDVACK